MIFTPSSHRALVARVNCACPVTRVRRNREMEAWLEDMRRKTLRAITKSAAAKRAVGGAAGGFASTRTGKGLMR